MSLLQLYSQKRFYSTQIDRQNDVESMAFADVPGHCNAEQMTEKDSKACQVGVECDLPREEVSR